MDVRIDRNVAAMMEDEARLSASSPAVIVSSSLALNTLRAHTDAVIMGYAAVDSMEDVRRQRRLAELGFLPGERVRVVSRGWFKRSPVAVRVADSTFALRDDEAALVLVQPISPQS